MSYTAPGGVSCALPPGGQVLTEENMSVFGGQRSLYGAYTYTYTYTYPYTYTYTYVFTGTNTYTFKWGCPLPQFVLKVSCKILQR